MPGQAAANHSDVKVTGAVDNAFALKTLLSDVAAAGAGESFRVEFGRRSFQAVGSVQAGTGAVSVKAQGSNDGDNWVDLGTIALTLGVTETTDGFNSDAAWHYVRGYVVSISGTGAVVSLLLNALPDSPVVSDVEPVTTEDMKKFLRVDHGDDDDLIGALVAAARELVESITSRRCITQTVESRWDSFPAEDRFLTLPLAPVQSVTSVVYYDKTEDPDDEDAGTVMSADDYIVDVKSEPARIILKDTADWPSPAAGLLEANAVVVTQVVGYGVDGSFVPKRIRQAISLLTSLWYENRSEAELAKGASTFQSLPVGVQALLADLRLFRRDW